MPLERVVNGPRLEESVERWIDQMLAPAIVKIEQRLDAEGVTGEARADLLADAFLQGRQEAIAALVRQVELSVKYDDLLRRWLLRARPAGQPGRPS